MSVMNASVALALPSDNQETSPNRVLIGKDVLELLSTAMYVDPLTVFREYIQNSADAIDAAREAGVLKPDDFGCVHIDIDSSTRSVRIRDNGTGVRASEFASKLTALGASSKR